MSTALPYRGRPVKVNVYDLIEKNDLLYGIGMGILHTGVVVDGREYSYGEGGGIISSIPRNVLGVKYRETIDMGETFLSPAQIKDVIRNMRLTYRGDNYDLISKNCNNFSNELCTIIVGKGIPAYINRCASVANWMSKKGSQLKGFIDKLEIKSPALKSASTSEVGVCSDNSVKATPK